MQHGTQKTNPLGTYYLASLSLSAVLLMSSTSLYAEGVFLIQEKPEPIALANIMFPNSNESSQEAPKYKLRGIRFKEAPVTTHDSNTSILDESASESTNSLAGSTVGFSIQFAMNSPELLAETLPYLDSVGEMLLLEQTKDAKLIVAGHADASGDASYNLSLSQARATAVADYIKTKFKVEGHRVNTVGYGESTPLPNADPYDAINRRVEFHPAP